MVSLNAEDGRSTSHTLEPIVKTAIYLLISAILFIGGLLLMGTAPTVSSWQAEIFIGGLLSITAAFFIPINLIRK